MQANIKIYQAMPEVLAITLGLKQQQKNEDDYKLLFIMIKWELCKTEPNTFYFPQHSPLAFPRIQYVSLLNPACLLALNKPYWRLTQIATTHWNQKTQITIHWHALSPSHWRTDMNTPNTRKPWPLVVAYLFLLLCKLNLSHQVLSHHQHFIFHTEASSKTTSSFMVS